MEDTWKPVVSIVMPAYNSAPYVASSIRTVLSQSFGDWELLVSDNGSRDDTRAIVEKFAAQDARIRLLDASKAKRCAAAARRFAIDKAQGDWIALLDSDDLWQPDKLERQLRLAEETGSRFLFSASAFMNARGERLKYVLHVPEIVDYRRLLKQDIISTSSVLIRRELLEGCFIEQTNAISEDFAAWLRVLRDREPFARGIDEPLLIYRLSPQQTSANKLRNAMNTYRTYRAVDVGTLPAMRNWLAYVARSLRKYSGLWTSRPLD